MAAPRPETQQPRQRGRGTLGGTSLGGGKVKTGHRVHGMKEESTTTSRRGRSKSRDGRKSKSKSKSKSVQRKQKPKARIAYNTPFDEKGRCHYHVNVQLASKKFNGGWKVLCNACPKCMEQRSDTSNDGDEKSVRSGRSTRSGRTAASSSSRAVASSSGGAGAGGVAGQHDKNGCCVLHPHIQVAKKNFLGSGWKVIRTCPSCSGGTSIGLDDDAISVKSGRSTSSRKSTRSTKSSKSKKGSTTATVVAGKATQSGRYGALPFDGDGYCCRHPSVQIAQKKMMGGFKIVHNVCPSCAVEDGIPADGGKSRRGRSRSKSRARRSSSKNSRHHGDDCSSKKKKRIRVKNLKTEDEEGKAGRYSGYVNDEHQPHGEGLMKYEDGCVYEGVWSEGSKVHGKTKRKQ